MGVPGTLNFLDAIQTSSTHSRPVRVFGSMIQPVRTPIFR